MNNGLTLMKHQLEKFGVVTVLDAMLYDIATNKPVLELNTLKVANITGETSQKSIDGGIDNKRLLDYYFAKVVNIEITDALASTLSLATVWGGELLPEGTEVEAQVVFTTTTSDTGVIMLTDLQAEKAINGGRFIGGLAYGTDGTEYAITVDSVDTPTTITVTGITAPTTVRIIGQAAFKETEGYAPRQLTILGDKFPNAMKLVGTTYVLDATTGKRVRAELVIPKMTINPNIALNFDAAGDAATFGFTSTALADDNGELFIFKTLVYEK